VFFNQITDSLCAETPERAEVITQNAGYLERFVKCISIRAKDHVANNGGCPESHVSQCIGI
jgi:hypothetical protein